MGEILGIVNKSAIPHFKLASNLQLCLKLKIGCACDSKKLTKFARIQAPMSFGDIAWQ
jgi:hypothetical protein